MEAASTVLVHPVVHRCLMYITTGFRDKPWLLVLGTLAVGAVAFLGALWVLKYFNLSNAWDVLFTGGGYFTKTKIFGTVAEANAPDRGYMFASFGPMCLSLPRSGTYFVVANLQ